MFLTVYVGYTNKRNKRYCQAENNNMNEKVNIELIIERAMTAFNCKTQKQLADLFNTSPENLSNKKRRGTLTKLIEKEADRNKINYDWIKTGQGEMMTGANVASCKMDSIVREALTPYTSPTKFSPSDPHPDIQEAIKYTITAFKILTSGTGYASALRENIIWFDEAVDDKKRMRKIEDDMATLKQQLLASGTLSSK